MVVPLLTSALRPGGDRCVHRSSPLTPSLRLFPNRSLLFFLFLQINLLVCTQLSVCSYQNHTPTAAIKMYFYNRHWCNHGSWCLASVFWHLWEAQARLHGKGGGLFSGEMPTSCENGTWNNLLKKTLCAQARLFSFTLAPGPARCVVLKARPLLFCKLATNKMWVQQN